MKATRRVNSLIRRNLRRIRIQKGLALGEAASRAEMPLSSYSCLESGHYAISLENLSRILGALETDISKVWPYSGFEIQGQIPWGYSHQIQMLRLQEILCLSEAAGVALFSVQEDSCRTLLHEALSEREIEILADSIERGNARPAGLWFSSHKCKTRYLVFLKAASCPDFVKQLIRHYLVIWTCIFE